MATTHMISEPGFYEIEEADYRADPAPQRSLNKTIAHTLLESCPKTALFAYEHPGADADTKFDRGTVAHAMLLGKGRSFRVIDAPDYRTKAAQMQRDAYREAGLTPILVDHHATASAMVAEARRQLDSFDGGEFAFNPKFGEIELCGLSRDPIGCWGRTLIDFYGSRIPSGVVCWDYKTTSGSANPALLRPIFNRLGWSFQAAFQERIIVTLKPALAGKIKFRFFVQENEEPYLCSVVEPSSDAMTIAHKMVAAAFAIWKNCLDRNQWPGYPRTSQPIGVLPGTEAAWLSRELEDEMVMLAADDPFLCGLTENGGHFDSGKVDDPETIAGWGPEQVLARALRADGQPRKPRGPYGPRKPKGEAAGDQPQQAPKTTMMDGG